MSVEVECAACFNRGSGVGWVARTSDGHIQWLCPACVASNSQPIPIVSAEDLVHLTQSQAQRAISVCPNCGAAVPTGKCPLCQLRSEARGRAIILFAFPFTVVIAIHLVCGVVGGITQGNMTRAVAAVLGGALPAGLVAGLAVTSLVLSRRGQQSWIVIAGRYLLLPAVLCTLLGCAMAFFPFAAASRPLLSIFGEAALYVSAAAALGAAMQWIATSLGMVPARQAMNG